MGRAMGRERGGEGRGEEGEVSLKREESTNLSSDNFL